ncbi:MAG: DNA translocase FtsK 4TM domain-containing protein [Elusimicrobia bacterium]|nr:DNA translocase FtsK 4TM domain-containing protein [Elusimicrobiota bacterium]
MKRNDIRGLILLIIGILILWFLFFPQHSGLLGRYTTKILFRIFGQASYIFPIVLTWLGVKIIFNKKLNSTSVKFISDIFVVWSICTIFSLATPATNNYGGFIGKYSEIGLNNIVGIFGGWVVTFGILIISVFLTTGISFEDFMDLLKKIFKPKKKKILWEAEEKATERSLTSKELTPKVSTQKVLIPKPVIIKTEETKQVPVKQIPIAKITGKIAAEKTSAEKTSIVRKTEEVKIVNEQLKYELPPLDLLDESKAVETHVVEDELRECAEKLIKTLADFNITATVEAINPGPSITRYDIVLAPGTKVSSITNLSNDISLSMKTESIRVLAPIPGKSAVGIEIPNPKQAIVGLKEILKSKKFIESKSLLTFALGKTTSGEPFCDDLAPMPHLLIAGATGSGKSVCINSIIMSLICRTKPDELKFLLIDPKRLELPVYEGIPHLFVPGKKASEATVITDAKEAAKALGLLVKVMEHRYKTFAKKSVRNIDGYNEKIEKEGGKKEYYIVVIIDELADLMLIASREVEESIQRLAQMARAVGIHLVLATQRPSVDVITGVIKGNLPARIAFQVLSKTDSRVVLDVNGAEDLIGRGDMLYLPTGYSRPLRLQGNYVSLKEIEKVVKFIKKQAQPDYEDIFETIEISEKKETSEETKKELVQALELALERKRISYDLLKTNGFGSRAADVLSRLEVEGFIRKPEGTNRWEVFVDKIEEYLSVEREKA